MARGAKPQRETTVWKVVGPYLIGAIAWILVSDALVSAFVDDAVIVWQVAKGLLFVLLTAAILYVSLKGQLTARRASEEKRAELERRLAATARFEAIGRLTGGIAHDFNNLLTVISGNLESYADSYPQHQVDELEDARTAAERARDLTRQLLTYGRQQVSFPEYLDVGQVLEEAGTLLERVIKPPVTFRLSAPPDLWPVHIDRAQLEQVIMNLALNARDAMPDGGELRVAARNEQLSPGDLEQGDFEVEPGEYVLIEVADTGIGMDADTRARVFEPFFTTKKEVGAGLGLSTVYGIVKTGGGYVTVESERDGGTTFRVYLPRAGSTGDAAGSATSASSAPPTTESPAASAPRSPRVPPAPSAHSPPAGTSAVAAAAAADRQTVQRAPGTETVLVVEDEEAVRRLITKVLKRRGYRVLEAGTGREGLEVIDRTEDPIDLVVTDAIMPELSGTELIRRARERGLASRYLLISGYTGPDIQVEGVPYLAKPFTPAVLLERVREVLESGE